MGTQLKQYFSSFLLALISAVSLLITSACTGTHYRSFTIDSSPKTSLSIDARQRVVLTTDHGGSGRDKHVVCAEPSPDVFATAALSTALNAKVSGKEIGGALSRVEMAGALGIRTQTIQLLRDGLYRACEAYMNGAIEAKEYKNIIFAYDELLITLVAVEGLTQQIRTSPPVIGGEAKSTPNTEGDDTSTNAIPSGAAATMVSTQLPSDEIARQVHAIVRDYYCFQLGLKELFYGTSGSINAKAFKHLCGKAQAQ